MQKLIRRLAIIFFLLACVAAIAPAVAESKDYWPLNEIAFYPERSAPATVMSLNHTVISARLNAEITEVYARASAEVKRGDLLAKLDCTDYLLEREMARARLESAQAMAKLATSRLVRTSELFGRGLTSEQNLDVDRAEKNSSKAMVKQQQVALKQAEVNVARCAISSPISGIVAERSAATGQLVNPGSELFTVVDTEQLELSVDIGFDDALRLSEVTEFVFDYGLQAPAILYNAGGLVDSRARSVAMRFVFPEHKPMSGTAGRLRWRDPRRFVPADYVVERNGERGVFVLTSSLPEQGHTVHFHPLANALPGRPAAIDLPADTLIVTTQLGTLNDGDSLASVR